jgi:hypothetical protein
MLLEGERKGGYLSNEQADDVSAAFLRWLTIADPISISKSILTTLLLMLIASEEWWEFSGGRSR